SIDGKSFRASRATAAHREGRCSCGEASLIITNLTRRCSQPSTCCNSLDNAQLHSQSAGWLILFSLGGRRRKLKSAMNRKEALAFVERHGIVLQAAHGPFPNLTEAIAGGAIKGSWWGHPKGKEIFRAVRAIGEN